MPDSAPAPVGRAEIISALHTSLEGDPAVLAAFLGGSDATGRTDSLSDIDLVVIVEAGTVENTFTTMHTALEALSPIIRRWRLAEPTWHGHAQEFLALRDAAPQHVVDVVVQEPTGGERLLEAERHGAPLVLFDRAGVVTSVPVDHPRLQVRIDARLAILREQFPMFQTLVTRAVRRGFAAEAAVAYHDHTYRPLIELLRIRHCPQRFDFGARYLDRDLPAPLRAEVESLALPTSLEEVESFRERAQTMFATTLADLDRPAPPSPPAHPVPAHPVPPSRPTPRSPSAIRFRLPEFAEGEHKRGGRTAGGLVRGRAGRGRGRRRRRHCSR